MKCRNCEKIVPKWKRTSTCPDCNAILEFRYDYEALSDRESQITERNDIWRFHSFLPVSSPHLVSIGEGVTPLLKANRLTRKWADLSSLWLKNESLNPTGSFLDRGASVALSRAKELQVESLACGTKGNLGASVSAYAAKSGLECKIFIPKQLEMEKLYQMTLFGAKVKLTDDYEEAIENARRSSSFTLTIDDPYLLEGLKTTAFEIFDQLEKIPEKIVVGVGTGSHISMMWKGFKELKRLGWVKNLPTLIGVQSQAVNPITKMFHSRSENSSQNTHEETIAKDLAFLHPPLGEKAIKSVKESDGTFMSVSDEEILTGVQILAENEGLLSEPAGAVPVAATQKLLREGLIRANETVVMVITGAGLKDHRTMRTLVEKIHKEKAINSLMKKQEKVSRIGKTKQLILQILSNRKDYGYHIHKVLKRKFNVSVALPTVYEHLRELVELGLLTKVSSEAEKKYYLLSEKGRKIVEE